MSGLAVPSVEEPSLLLRLEQLAADRRMGARPPAMTLERVEVAVPQVAEAAVLRLVMSGPAVGVAPTCSAQAAPTPRTLCWPGWEGQGLVD